MPAVLHFHAYPGLALIAVLTKHDKRLPCKATSIDGDKATDATVTNTPVDGGYVMPDVNGQVVGVGDGAKNREIYFSDDGGVTAKAIEDIAAGDTIHWMGSIAGYELDTSDRISLNYDI